MAQLYAACRQGGQLEVRHVQLAAQVQQHIEPFFQALEAEFAQGVDNEVDFTGDWTPDEDEFLVLRGHPEAAALLAGASQNAVALQPLDAANFETEGVKALFTAVGPAAQRRLLIQSFSPQQLLTRRFALLFDGNVFDRLTEPVFSLENNLLAIVDSAGDVRFKSFHLLRRVFDIAAFFQQATDPELHAFCGHGSLAIADANAFVQNADESVRKAVHAISRANILGTYPVANIEAQAATIGFPLVVDSGRISVPPDKRAAKALFSFLLDKVYRGALAQQLLITNSNRPL